MNPPNYLLSSNNRKVGKISIVLMHIHFCNGISRENIQKDNVAQKDEFFQHFKKLFRKQPEMRAFIQFVTQDLNDNQP